MIDILLNDSGDLLMEANDLVMGESTVQNQRLLLISNKGDFKENPMICVGTERWLKDDAEAVGLLGEIKSEFEKDGMKVNSVDLTTDGKLNVDANY